MDLSRSGSYRSALRPQNRSSQSALRRAAGGRLAPSHEDSPWLGTARGAGGAPLRKN